MMDLSKWELFRELDSSFISMCKLAQIIRTPKVGFLVLQNDDVYAVTNQEKNLKWLGNGNNYTGAVVNQPSKVEALCGKSVKNFYGNFKSIAALTNDGCLYRWGIEGIPEIAEFPVSKECRVDQVACGIASGFPAVCLTTDGEVYGWGSYSGGHIGVLLNSQPTCSGIRKITGLSDRIVQVAAGPVTYYALDSLGKIAAGPYHVLALSESGELYFWGSFDKTTITSTATKINIPNDAIVTDIASSVYASYGVFVANGKVHLWGTWYKQNITTPLATPFCSMDDAFAHAELPVMLNPIRRSAQPQGIVDVWKRAFDDHTTSDVMFSVDRQVLHAHTVFLRLRSEYFRKMFENEWQETSNQSGEIKIEGFSFGVFKSFMYFLYTDCLLELDMPVEDLIELMRAADYYGENELRSICEKKLKNLLTPENACVLYTCAVQLNGENLRNWTAEFVGPVLKKVVNSVGFAEMSSELKTQFMVHVTAFNPF